MSQINNSAKQMNALAEKYLAELDGKPKCVHRTLLLRTLIILKEIRLDSEALFAPVLKTFMTSSKRPDKKGDYEKGMGRHYYCAANSSGKELSPINSYYRNGMGIFTKSARVMFEEDYTMALTMYHAGFDKQWAEHLGRAVHMLSDMCCLPHASSMTYFSSAAKFHKAYELLAESIYPHLVPEQISTELPDIFRSKNSFAEDLNAIAIETANGLDDVFSDPFEAVCGHLLRTERILAAFLLRFCNDTVSQEHEAHFITSGSGCRLMKGTSPLTVKITENGIIFHGVNPSPESSINVTNTTFFAAHRHNGLFTLSPARDKKGVVLEVNSGKLVWKKFDPVHGEQLFRL